VSDGPDCTVTSPTQLQREPHVATAHTSDPARSCRQSGHAVIRPGFESGASPIQVYSTTAEGTTAYTLKPA
jgi:hypothetical protein